MKRTLVVGEVIEVTIEKVAHGGHFIARHEGCVIFVRHAIPGEKCQIEINSVGSSFNRADVVAVIEASKVGSSFNRADVVEVIEASKDRVVAPCEYSHRQGCGGCDFQHVSIARQRSLKADVITEQFARIAKMDISVEVESVGTELGWRSRINATTDRNGKLGFIGSRSHTVIPVKNCLVAAKEIDFSELATRTLVAAKEIGFSELATRTWKGDMRVEIAASNTGERSISLMPTRGETKSRLSEGPAVLHEKVLEKTLEVGNNSFWQGHVTAPDLLSEVVKDFADVKSADHVLDLYGGVGLFAAALIEAVGPEGRKISLTLRAQTMFWIYMGEWGFLLQL